MSSSFLDARARALVVCLSAAVSSACGGGSTPESQAADPGAGADAEGDAGDDGPAPPRHYAPGALPSCADARPKIEPGVSDAGDAAFVEEAAFSDAGTVEETQADAADDDASTV